MGYEQVLYVHAFRDDCGHNIVSGASDFPCRDLCYCDANDEKQQS